MLKKSPIIVILDKVKEAEGKGIKIINLAIGEPDFSVPDYIKEAAIEKIKTGGKEIDGYTETAGIKELREAIAKKFNKELGESGKWQAENVIVTPGAKFALFSAMRAIKETSSEKEKGKPSMMILNPAWPTFAAQARLAGMEPVFVEALDKEINFEMLELAARGFDLKAMLINSPSNPTGRILKDKELEVINSFASKHDIWIISDEIYRKISYIPLPLPMAHFAPDRTITIGGFSKEYAMTGWRLGWAIAPKEIISEMAAWQSQTITCASSIVQYAGLAALGDSKAVEKMVEEFARRREIVAQKLAEIPGITFQKPDGAFYFFINVKEYLVGEIKTIESLADYLFDKAQVAIAPGSAFGASNYIRLSFAASEDDLNEAVSRIKSAFGELKS